MLNRIVTVSSVIFIFEGKATTNVDTRKPKPE